MGAPHATTAPAPRPQALQRAFQTILVAVVSGALLVVLVQQLHTQAALGIALLALAGLAMLVRPELATLLTVFLIYINFPAILTKQHGLPHVVAGSFVLLLGFPLLHRLIQRREPLRADLTFALMLLLLAVYLVSAASAIDTGVALRTISEYVLEGLLLFWLIFNVVRSARTLRRVVWTILAAGALLSGLSLYQTATGSYGQEFHGLAYRDYERTRDVGGAPPERRESWDRARGPLDEPNRFAQILLVLVPLAAALARGARSRAARLCAAGLGLLVVGGILATLSRGGFAALLLLLLLMVTVRWVRVSRVLLATAVLALAAPSIPFFMDRMVDTGRALGLIKGEETAPPSQLDSASLIRVSVMLAAGHVFLDHPILGVGPGQFAPFYSQRYSRVPEMSVRDLPPGDWRAHSLYLGIAAESGLLGLCAFLAIVVTLVLRLWARRRLWLPADREMSDLATALALSLIAYQVSGLFLHLSYQPYYWFLVALAAAAIRILTPDPFGHPVRPRMTRAAP